MTADTLVPMRLPRASLLVLLAFTPLLTAVTPGVAAAQTVPIESVGERALGMGGAFVAVADDATAVAWNPAGLATGRLAGMTIGWHQLQLGNQDAAPAAGARRQRTTLTSFGTLPLGLSLGTIDVSEIVATSDGSLETRTFRANVWGVSLLQTVFPDVVVGGTVKLIRGGQAVEAVGAPTAGDALSSASDADVDRHTTMDFDLSAMANAPKLRIGLLLKNLRSPQFREGNDAGRPLKRQGRLGVAFLPADGVTLAMDLDLNTVDLMGGLRRMCAVGGEAALGSRLSVRSGIRWSVKGAHDPIGSLGASVRLSRAIWIDGHYAGGNTDEAREMGVALRMGI
jgi:hypothetical protein